MMWSLSSWRSRSITHIPNYNPSSLLFYQNILQQKNGIVTKEAIDRLQGCLVNLKENNDFIVHIGECAEMFSWANKQDITKRVNLLKDFSNTLKIKGNIIKIGRIAGQYSKPRSQDSVLLAGKEIPTYKGDMVNSYKQSVLERSPRVGRFLRSYYYARKTYKFIQKVDPQLFTSHEALMLPYEEALTRLYLAKFYNLSAHFLWIGRRTFFENSAHVEYLRGIANPIGIKVDAKIEAATVISLIKVLNPYNHKGRITLINRMGNGKVLKKLPKLIDLVLQHKLEVLWMLDPMHGNTVKKQGKKIRYMEHIIEEIIKFKSILDDFSVYFAGIHLEATYHAISECLSNDQDDLNNYTYKSDNYSSCDPRLNYNQTMEVAKQLIKCMK